MTIIDEGKQLRAEAAKLRPDRRRRYPPEYRQRVLDWVERATAAGFTRADCGRVVGIKTWRFHCWREEPELVAIKETRDDVALVPVAVVPSTTVVTTLLSMTAPSGHRIDGLTLQQALMLLRELA
jgi:hypothetical protein